MNLNGIATKVTNKADKLAMLYGVLADPIADGRGLGGAPSFMIDRLSGWHIPDPMKLIEMIQFYPQYSNNLQTALMLYLGGEVLDAVGVSKWSNIAKKAGVGLAKGVGLGAILWLPKINNGWTGSGSTANAIGNEQPTEGADPLQNEFGGLM
jgi:hypothetical protein